MTSGSEMINDLFGILEDEKVSDSEEINRPKPNEYHIRVFEELRQYLFDEKDITVFFEVISSGHSPFDVVVSGPDSKSVASEEYFSELQYCLRYCIAKLSPSEKRIEILNRTDWPLFKIRLEEPIYNSDRAISYGAAMNEYRSELEGSHTCTRGKSEDRCDSGDDLHGGFTKYFLGEDHVIIERVGFDVHVPTSFSLKDQANQLGVLLAEKNAKYGNSFHSSEVVFKLLYPDGVQPHQYADALFLIRIWDKMKRIATDKDAFGESPYQDIAGYAILGLERLEYEKKAQEATKQPQEATKQLKTTKG